MTDKIKLFVNRNARASDCDSTGIKRIMYIILYCTVLDCDNCERFRMLNTAGPSSCAGNSNTNHTFQPAS